MCTGSRLPACNARNFLGTIVGMTLAASLGVSSTAQGQGPFRRLGDRIRARVESYAPQPPVVSNRAVPVPQQPGQSPYQRLQPVSPRSPQPDGDAKLLQSGQSILENPQAAQSTPGKTANAQTLQHRPVAPFVPSQGPATVSYSETVPRNASMGIEVAEVRTGQPGVQIIQFQPGSRAEQAGLRKGDVIISVNGKTVASIADVASQLSPLKPGQSVDVLVVPAGTPTVARGNTARLLTRSFSVPLVSRSGAAASAPSSNFSNGDRPLTELGLVVRNSSSRDGVLVTSVVANSAAEKARLVAGDRIVSVNGARVTDIETLNRVIAARDASSDALRLQWVRGSQLREAPVKLTSSDNGSTDQDPSANDGVTATSGKSILNQLGAALGAAVRNKIQPEPTPQESESLPAPLSALEPTESTVQPIESPVDRPLEPIKTDPLELGDDEPVEKALFQDEKPTDKTK